MGASSRDDFEPTETSKGVCFGLSIWWVIKNATRQDFWGWTAGAGPQVAEIKAMFVSQKGEHEFTRFDSADQKMRVETGMTRQNKMLMKEGTAFKHTGYHYISRVTLPADPWGSRYRSNPIRRPSFARISTLVPLTR